MELIPVIDIKNGIAVHAKLGQREHYLPIQSALCPSHKVASVIDCFLELADFKIMYLADLNAITNDGDNQALIKALLQDYPKINFWVDSGFQAKPSALLAFENYRPILGSECYSDKEVECLKLFEKNFILSLDFSAQGLPLGSEKLFHEQQWWTQQIILMTLARVGSNLGVDLEKLTYYQSLNSKVEFIASGGVRSIEDAKLLQELGVKKALCASALHNKAITAEDIKKLQAKKYPD